MASKQKTETPLLLFLAGTRWNYIVLEKISLISRLLVIKSVRLIRSDRSDMRSGFRAALVLSLGLIVVTRYFT